YRPEPVGRVAAEHRPAVAHHPNITRRRAPHFEEGRNVVMLVLWQVAGQHKGLPALAVVVPNETIAAGARPHRVHVRSHPRPKPVYGIFPEARGLHSDEVGSVVTKNVRIRSGEENRTILDGVGPPEVSMRSGRLLLPMSSVPMQNERPRTVVGSRQPDVVRG